tara:strand:+ start:801 stop:1169 length:369 start_codon:yes stop_codon:yes gene_type:complete
MASTSLKNLPGQYCKETTANRINSDYLVFKNKTIPVKSAFPDLGINVGNMAGAYTHGILSNNTADLESYLFGIGTSNLVKTFSKPNTNMNQLDNLKFFEKPGYAMPNPLIVENRQRPIGPFS